MFRHQNKTNFPPKEKPLFVWDGECGFCHYWIIRWKMITLDKINYQSYQRISKEFPDIPVERFKEAVRLIETDGFVTSGPQAAYRSLYLIGKYEWLFSFYQTSSIFKWISDNTYQVVATNREKFFNITKLLFGKNPRLLKPYWLFYLIVLTGLLFLIFFL